MQAKQSALAATVAMSANGALGWFGYSSLNAKLRRSVRSRGHFPSDEAAMKLIWLQLREITKNWKMPPREWSAAKAQFAVVCGDRFEVNR